MNLDMTSYLKVHYQGYDGVAKAQLQFDRQAFEVTVDKVKSENMAARAAWDELEKSIVANIADDVKVSVKGNNVELVIEKKLFD